MSRSRNALLVAAVSGIALLVGGLGAAQLRHAIAGGPMLSAPHGIVVDDTGRIFCGVRASDIYVYDAGGTLVAAWTVPDADGDLRLALAPDDRLEVASRNGDRLHVYERSGGLVETREDPGAFERIGPENDLRHHGADGSVHALRDAAIVRFAPAPEVVLVPALRWPLSAVAAHPMVLAPLLFGGGVGLIYAAILAGRARRAT